MRFMVMVPATAESESGVLPDPEMFAEMGRFNEELARDGVLLAAEGLQPTAKGAKLRFSGGHATVRDGPFTETKELIAGFWLIETRSKEEAIERMSRAPFGGGIEIELRQVYEFEDLAPVLPTDVLEQNARLRAQMRPQ